MSKRSLSEMSANVQPTALISSVENINCLPDPDLYSLTMKIIEEQQQVLHGLLNELVERGEISESKNVKAIEEEMRCHQVVIEGLGRRHNLAIQEQSMHHHYLEEEKKRIASITNTPFEVLKVAEKFTLSPWKPIRSVECHCIYCVPKPATNAVGQRN